MILFAAAGEILLWFVMGETGLLQYGTWVGIGIVGIAFTASLLPDKGKQDKAKQSKSIHDKDKQNYVERDSWKMHFDDDQIEDIYQEKEKGQGQGKEKPDEPETILLADFSGSANVARFESLSRERESIEISYLPFVIGKYAELADHCLQQSTVSRLHMRLDKKEGVYTITDLNSTNGTTVNGYQLQANETVSIKSGDTIYLADLGYRFSELL